MGGGVYGADGAVRLTHGTIRTVHMTYAASLRTTGCRKPYAATYHLVLVMTGICARNMSS